MFSYVLILIVIALSVYLWRRERSKLSVHNLWFCIVVFLFSVVEDFIHYRWHLTGMIKFINDTINAVFWTAAVIIWILIMVKFLTRTKNLHRENDRK